MKTLWRVTSDDWQVARFRAAHTSARLLVTRHWSLVTLQ
jgi:hypothetical protein